MRMFVLIGVFLLHAEMVIRELASFFWLRKRKLYLKTEIKERKPEVEGHWVLTKSGIPSGLAWLRVPPAS